METEEKDKTTVPKSDRVLRHVVLFKFAAHAGPAELSEIGRALSALRGKIPEILDLEWGTDVSIEGKSQGFTHCLLVTFAGEAQRAVYLPHPEHKKFGQKIREEGLLEDVIVFDYWTPVC